MTTPRRRPPSGRFAGPGRPSPPGRRTPDASRPRPGDPSARYAPRSIQRSPGLDEDPATHDPRRPAASPLKRLEEERKEQARRRESVRVGVRLTAMGIVVIGLFGVMVFRLWSLQVLHSSSAISNVISLTTRDVAITPPRGLIEARGGQVLVSNKVEPVITLNRQVAAADPAVVRRLAVTLGISLAQITAAINDQQDSIYQPVPVEVGASPSVIVYLSEHRSMFPGVTVSNVAEPQYPYGSLASQVLGFTGAISPAELKQLKGQGYVPGDVIGQAGIEWQYERYLRGRTGTRQLLVDASGDPVGTKHVVPAVPGDNVVLNIDIGLQRAAQSILQGEIRSLAGNGVNSGAVVVEDPRNGAILAMASAPNYNPSWWVGGMSTAHYKALTRASAHEPMLNRAIQGLYTPGSTFKLATATAALNTGLVTPYTLISDPGSFTVPNCSGSCTFYNNAGESCGACNIVTGLSMSDDVFFYTLGYWFYSRASQYGPDPIQKAASAYGWGRPSGIDLPGEYYGQVDSPQLRVAQHRQNPSAFPNTYYGPGNAIITAFGQGETLLTPLQLANAYATFANGGTRYSPRVAAEIVSPTGRVIRRIRPRVMDHVSLPSTTYQTILRGLEGVFTQPIGTAYPTAQALHYPYAKLPLAGKTGTSQLTANTNSNNTDSLFVAFGPTSNPKYVIAAAIPHAGYGASAAAPVVIKLFEYLIHHPTGPLRPSAPAGAG